MIAVLLRQLCDQPAAHFEENELRGEGDAAFGDLKRLRLIRPAPTLAAGGTVSLGSRLLTLIEASEGGLEAIDLDDPSFRPVKQDIEDLLRWQVDLQAVAEHFRRRNDLSGTPRPVSPYIWYVGRRGEGPSRLDYLLALVPDREDSSDLLLAAKVRLENSPTRIVAVCPAYKPGFDIQRSHQTAGIAVVALPEDDSFLLPIPQPPQASADNWYTPGYRQILWDHQWRPLTPNQARVVELFDNAGSKPLGQDFILTELDIESKNLYQVFRGSWAWQALVIRTGPAMYRLNTPEIH